jgi:hypothetical protein
MASIIDEKDRAILCTVRRKRSALQQHLYTKDHIPPPLKEIVKRVSVSIVDTSGLIFRKGSIFDMDHKTAALLIAQIHGLKSIKTLMVGLKKFKFPSNNFYNINY